MRRAIQQVDGVLRGRATRPELLGKGKLEVQARPLLGASIVLAVAYGVCMGTFAVIRTGGASADAWMQLLASAVKLPLLFLLTLLVTLPSLYVFNVLMGARLSPRAMIRLMSAMLAVILSVLASFGPIVAFFGVSTTSYPFMKVLNVAVCGIARVLGLAFLLRTLRWLVAALGPMGDFIPDETEPDTDPAPPESEPETPPSQSETAAPTTTQGLIAEKAAAKRVGMIGSKPLDTPAARTQRATLVFRVWVVIFSLVGAQMSWVLRPFIGDPNMPFTWFRSRESNFFIDLFDAIVKLFGG